MLMECFHYEAHGCWFFGFSMTRRRPPYFPVRIGLAISQSIHPVTAGMMLEMDNSELLLMLESETQLRQKVDEALRVLQAMPK